MSILKNAYRNIFIREPNTERPPAALMSGMMNGSIAPASQGGTLSQMQTYGNTGWIHAVVERIATSIASTDWTIYQTSANGDRQELFRHPLTMLWNSVNPYDTRETLMEMTQQHLELTGEAWWILLRNTAGIPQEIWCVRPDRMHVVPSREDFIAGYMYQLGSEKIPLEKKFLP
jgi:phage portal protein BeeE